MPGLGPGRLWPRPLRACPAAALHPGRLVAAPAAGGARVRVAAWPAPVSSASPGLGFRAVSPRHPVSSPPPVVPAGLLCFLRGGARPRAGWQVAPARPSPGPVPTSGRPVPTTSGRPAAHAPSVSLCCRPGSWEGPLEGGRLQREPGAGVQGRGDPVCLASSEPHCGALSAPGPWGPGPRPRRPPELPSAGLSLPLPPLPSDRGFGVCAPALGPRDPEPGAGAGRAVGAQGAICSRAFCVWAGGERCAPRPVGPALGPCPSGADSPGTGRTPAHPALCPPR